LELRALSLKVCNIAKGAKEESNGIVKNISLKLNESGKCPE
jgi:hypothetical protein